MRYDQLCRHPSLSAMTLEHGRLLQESGFGKRDSRQHSSDNLGRTTIMDLIESSSLYGTVTGRLSSGRPEIPRIRRTDVPSTSAQRFVGTASMRYIPATDFSALEQRILSCSLRTCSPPLRSEPLTEELGTQSWVRRSECTPQRHSQELASHLYSRGLTPTGLARQPASRYASNWIMSGALLSTLLHPSTRRHTAYEKSENE